MSVQTRYRRGRKAEPPARSHRDLILDHLASGRPLTADEARDLYGCRRLAARIHELRQAGLEVIREIADGEAVYRLGGGA